MQPRILDQIPPFLAVIHSVTTHCWSPAVAVLILVGVAWRRLLFLKSADGYLIAIICDSSPASMI